MTLPRILLSSLVWVTISGASALAQSCPSLDSNCPTYNQEPVYVNGNMVGYAQPMANGANITVNVYGSMGVNPYVVSAD